MCDRDFYTTLALVLFGVSGLIGNWIFGYMQDRSVHFQKVFFNSSKKLEINLHKKTNYLLDSMGRRPAFFIYLLIESVFAIATAFAPSYGLWLACRIGVGFTVPAIMGTPFVMGISYSEILMKIKIRFFFYC